MNDKLLTVINRGLSISILIGICVYSALENGFNVNLIKPIFCSSIIMCLIWFGDQIGSFTGYVGRGGNIDIESPGWLICTFGWILLIVVPMISLFASHA